MILYKIKGWIYMENKKEKPDRDIRLTRAFSVVVVAAIALIVFVGIVPAEEENRSITTGAAGFGTLLSNQLPHHSATHLCKFDHVPP